MKLRFLFYVSLFLLAFNQSAKAQLYNWGVHVAYNQTKLVPEKNFISDRYFLREGRGVPGFSIGANYSVGPPKEQERRGFNLKPIVLLEASLCRCGGNLSAAETLRNGSKTLSNLTYLFYRATYSAKLVLQYKKVQFMLGPTLSNIFYAGYRIDQRSGLISATNDVSFYGYGYELGFGIDFNRFVLSARYNSTLSDYIKRYQGVTAVSKISQTRVMVSYRLFQRHKGANWDSIIWD